LSRNSDVDLGDLVRSLLLVQGLDRSSATGLLPKILEVYRQKTLTTDSRSQLALFIVNEIRCEGGEGWLQAVSVY